MLRGVSPSAHSNNAIKETSFLQPRSHEPKATVQFRGSLEEYPSHLRHPTHAPSSSHPIHTLPDRSLSPNYIPIEKRNHPSTFVSNQEKAQHRPLKESPGKAIRQHIIGNPMDEIMELHPTRETKVTTPHVIVTKKAPTAVRIPQSLTQPAEKIEKKVIRLIPRKPERTNRNMHDILQERSAGKGKEQRDKHESIPKSPAEVIKIRAVGESIEVQKPVSQLKLKVSGHLKFVESSKSREKSQPKEKHIVFTYMNKPTVAPVKEVTIRNQQIEKYPKSKTENRLLSEPKDKQSTPQPHQLAQHTPKQNQKLVSPVPLVEVIEGEPHRGGSRIQESPFSSKPNLIAPRETFNSTQPNPQLQRPATHLGGSHTHYGQISHLNEENPQPLTDRSPVDKFGSPSHRLEEESRASYLKHHSNPHSKDSKSIDSSRRRKGLTLFDDGLSEWRRTHKMHTHAVANFEPTDEKIFGEDSDTRKQIESMVTPVHTRERSKIVEAEPHQSHALSPEESKHRFNGE